MKLLVLILSMTLSISYALDEDNVIVLTSYFGRGFGVALKEHVLLKRTEPAGKAYGPSKVEWRIIRLDKEGRPVANGIKMEFFTSSMEREFRKLTQGKTRLETTVIGHEIVEESGNPVPLPKLPSNTQDEKSDSEWKVQPVFLLRRIRAGGKLIPD